jgi:predicted RNase H-like nuclease (RuvC/YqgF family)
MKRLITSTYIVVALLLSTSLAVAQTSDYQIKKKYEDSYKELKTAINNAMTVNQIDSLSMEISNLKYRNEEHEELLDNALYPETFESSIANLQQNARNAEHKLLVIEDQNERLDRLSSELSNYKSEIAHLNNRTDSLRNAILNSEKSESNLSALVKRYRNSMQKRDEFVLSMIDSLFITYKDMNGETMAELSEKKSATIHSKWR